VVTGAGLGAIIIPWVMSAVADGFGLVAGMGFYLLMCGLMIVLAVAINALGPATTSARVGGSSPQSD
jgi:fucose permease